MAKTSRISIPNSPGREELKMRFKELLETNREKITALRKIFSELKDAQAQDSSEIHKMLHGFLRFEEIGLEICASSVQYSEFRRRIGNIILNVAAAASAAVLGYLLFAEQDPRILTPAILFPAGILFLKSDVVEKPHMEHLKYHVSLLERSHGRISKLLFKLERSLSLGDVPELRLAIVEAIWNEGIYEFDGGSIGSL